MSKKVQILMSSYNGEKFIRKQLDSIVGQDYEVSLLIRDDGSTDRTVDIIKEYCEKYDFIRLVEGQNIGVIKSFFELIRLSDDDMDYYSMADQDDIWFKDKIGRAVNVLDGMSKDKPCLYCGAQTLIDGEDNILQVKMLDVKFRPGFGNSLVENIATGCTCVINKALRDLAATYEPEHTIMHDWWLYMLASSMGEVYYDEKPVMYYRQHGNNTMGSRTNYIEEFKERFKRFSSNRGKLYNQMVSFSEKYMRSLSKNDAETLKIILNYRKDLGCRIWCIFSRKVYRQRMLDNLIFKILFFTDHI